MDIIVERGASLDVHKGTVVACVMGTGIKKEIRTYPTMTNDLFRLKEWLKEKGVTHVAMESTGVYWKPVFNVLEECWSMLDTSKMSRAEKPMSRIASGSASSCEADW